MKRATVTTDTLHIFKHKKETGVPCCAAGWVSSPFDTWEKCPCGKEGPHPEEIEGDYTEQCSGDWPTDEEEAEYYRFREAQYLAEVKAGLWK